MIIRVILAFLAFLLASYAYHYYRRQTPQNKKKLLWRFGVGGGLGILLLLIMTGRLHWLSGVIAAAVVLLQRSVPLLIHLFPLAHRWWRQRSNQSIGGDNSGNTSTVQSDYLRMELDHDTGEMRGDIIHGKFAGEKLESCDREKLEELLTYYAYEDEDSFNLLQAYLQRRFGDDFTRSENAEEKSQRSHQSSTSMNEREALEVLGLEAGATNQEILTAHKKLMQKLHPDRGGSNYLAAKVNEAKDFLIERG